MRTAPRGISLKRRNLAAERVVASFAANLRFEATLRLDPTGRTMTIPDLRFYSTHDRKKCKIPVSERHRDEFALSRMSRKRTQTFDVSVFLATADGGRILSRYRKGQIIFSQGEAADAVFYIEQGKVKISVVSKQGKEAIIAILGAGDFCGEGCLTGQEQRIATAAAMTESAVMRLEKAAMIRVIHSESIFAEMLISHLLARNARVEADLIDQLFNSSEKRLARILLLLAKFGKEGKPEPVLADISQEALAEMIGTTRSRVSSFMNKFRQLGFIDYNGGLKVHSSLLNVVLHDEPRGEE